MNALFVLVKPLLQILVFKFNFFLLFFKFLSNRFELSAFDFERMVFADFFFEELGHFLKFLILFLVGIDKFFALLIVFVVFKQVYFSEEFLNLKLLLAYLHFKEVIFLSEKAQFLFLGNKFTI